MNTHQVEKFGLVKGFVFFFFVLISFPLYAQCGEDGPDDTGQELNVKIVSYNGIEHHYQFEAQCKPQLPAIDALATYRYFWDFGDGTYSLEEKPYHEYINDGTYYPKVHLVKAYTSPINGLTLRTDMPEGGSGGDRVSVSIAGAASDASYDPNDGYTPPTFTDKNISLETAFDLVPGFLQTFILSFQNTCGVGGKKEVTFAYPDGMFSDASSTTFANPDNPAELLPVEVPQNRPPESANAVSPLHPTDPNLRFVGGDAPGVDDTIKFNIEFPEGSTNPVNVFLNLYASPFLPLDQDAMFNVQFAGCESFKIDGVVPEGNSLEKGVPPKSSHDPNYKYVDDVAPANDDKMFISGPGANKLTFRLAFQNEGSLPVGRVVVSDTLAEELDFNTFKLLNITLADTNTPKNICDYPPFYRDYVLGNINDPSHYYEMTKDPAKRIVSWTFKTYMAGAEMEYNGSMVPDEWTWGYIDFEIYTKCGLDEKASFTNHAGVFFEDQDPVLTNEVTVRRLCYNDKEFVYAGPGFDLDLVRIAQRFHPNIQFDSKTAMITGSRAGIKFPATIDTTRGSEFRYEPDTSAFSKLDPLRTTLRLRNQTKEKVYVDNLRYTICSRGGRNCYPISVYVLINPNSRDRIRAYECDGTCIPGQPVKDPYPCWWYYAAGLLFLILLLFSGGRRRRRRRRRGK